MCKFGYGRQFGCHHIEHTSNDSVIAKVSVDVDSSKVAVNIKEVVAVVVSSLNRYIINIVFGFGTTHGEVV